MVDGWKGKERKGEERKGKEWKGKEGKGKERDAKSGSPLAGAPTSEGLGALEGGDSGGAKPPTTVGESVKRPQSD